VWLRRLELAAVVLVLAFVAASAYLFIWPPDDSPHRSDAIVVLAGSHSARLRGGIALMERHFAPVLVVSRDPDWPPQNRYCGQRRPFPVICFQASPFSTRGEARAVARLAREHHWRTITIVTSRYHVFRAAMIFRRCFHGRLYAIGTSSPVRGLLFSVASEWAKLTLALSTRRTC
jgi:uncharacterized SAM-binding protein YcdF (DUF218 family)